MPINALAAEIDAARGTDIGLASAIRVFVLNGVNQPLTTRVAVWADV